MTGDDHGRRAGRATLLVRAVDAILGTHRSNGLSQVRLQRAALAGADTDLLVRPPVPALGALDFKSAVPLIETGYRHASEELAKSRLANRFGP
jgi:predicted acylesterase/phospholipase RssA